MSYSTSPRRTGLPRTVLRWLQSLDLTFSPRHFRRDFSNGYLIAEIFSWYYPEDIQMHSFENGTSLAIKLSNWSQVGKFFAKRNLKPIRELIDGTIHCKPGAAEIFVQDIYTMLTNRRLARTPFLPWRRLWEPEELLTIRNAVVSLLGSEPAARLFHDIGKIKGGKERKDKSFLMEEEVEQAKPKIKHIQDEEIDFTDRIYQEKLPMVARSTASKAIKSNIKLTEIMVEPNENKNRQKVTAIISMHMQRRLLEREQDPERFGIKPTLGARAIRRPSVLVRSLSTTNLPREKAVPVPSASTEIRGKMGVHFKAIQVKQAERCPFDVNAKVEASSAHFKGL